MSRRRRSEEGLTLIELVMTVAIMGIAFVALIGGMSSSFVAAATHRKQALAETYIRQYAEAMKGVAYASTYSTPATITSLMTASAAPNKFEADAPSSPIETCITANNCTQVITLTVHTADTPPSVTETIQIVKRK